MASIKGSESLDEWRRFFATEKNSSVFDILDQAITIAATDYPDEFETHKTRILNSIQGFAKSDQGSHQEVRKPHIIRIKIPQWYKDEKANEALMEAKKPCSDEPKVINKVAMDDKAIEERIVALATKRKLHDRYEEAEKAKRQKSIQVIDYVPEQPKLCSKPQAARKQPCLHPKKSSNNKSCLLYSRLVKC